LPATQLKLSLFVLVLWDQELMAGIFHDQRNVSRSRARPAEYTGPWNAGVGRKINRGRKNALAAFPFAFAAKLFPPLGDE